MDIILFPVCGSPARRGSTSFPVLEQAGRRTYPLTLPGMESNDADRSGITLRDHVNAVVEAIAPSLRWILLHLIREYARHIGHADLLQGSVDGLTGE